MVVTVYANYVIYWAYDKFPIVIFDGYGLCIALEHKMF